MPTEDGEHWQHWYDEVTGGPLRQGDVFRALAVPWFPPDMTIPAASTREADTKLTARVTTGDWIVLDASCDLDQRRCEHVIIAPVRAATHENLRISKEKKEKDQEKEYKERLEILRRGLYEARYLLAEHPAAHPPFELSFVEFRQHLLTPLEFLERNAQTLRLRLKPPFREQFGNWVGACFARVGPEDRALIPVFVPNLFDTQKLRGVEGMAPPAQATGRAAPQLAGKSSLRERFAAWLHSKLSG